MKRLAVTSFALAASLFAVASAETDWSAQSGAVTIPAGETWVADEGDMAAVNALTSITLERTVVGEPAITNVATLVLRNTTTVPKAGLLAGAGVVRKTGSSTWSAYANAQNDFTGDFHIAEGLVNSANATAFGKCSTAGVGGLYVDAGGAVMLNGADVKFIYRKVHLAGNGNAAQNRALFVGASVPNSGINYIVLEADASLDVGNNYYWISDQGPNAIKVYNSGRGMIELGPHTLTKYSSTLDTYFLSCDVSGTGSIVFKERSVVLREKSSWGTDENMGPAVFDWNNDSSRLRFYNLPKTPTRPVQFNYSTILECAGNNSNYKFNLQSTNYNALAGPVILNGENVTLKVWPDLNCNAQISLLGPVSGTGRLQVGNGATSSPKIGFCRLSGHNTYTGGTFVQGPGLIGLVADYSDSIPDYAATFVTNGYVAARFGKAADGTTDRWTKTDLWRCLNEMTFGTGGHFAIDASELEDATYSLSVAEINENVTNPTHRAIGSAGGTVRLSVPAGARETVKLAAGRGRVELVGGGTYVLDTENILMGMVQHENPDGLPVAEVRVTDGSSVELGDGTVYVGGRYYQKNNNLNHGETRLVISNATWTTTSTASFSSGGEPELAKGTIWVGHENRGILEIQEGAFLSNRVVVGGGSGYAGGQGTGAIYQRAGEFHLVREGAMHLSSSIGAAGYGYYEQSGGFFRSPTLAVANYGVGVAHVYGGTASINGSLELGRCNGGQGVLYITNGTWTVESVKDGGYLRVASGGSCSAMMTLDGPDAQLLLNSSIYGPQVVDGWAIFNVNHGATLRFNAITLYSGKQLNNLTTPQPMVLNLNGGILKPIWDDKMFGASAMSRFSRVAVYEEGLTVDTDGKSVTQIADAPFEGATGMGIAAIDLGGAVTNLLGAPRVVISNVDGGTGAGASAVAAWDPATRVLTGVHIVSRGWGYEQGKVKVELKIHNQWSKTLTGDAITVGENPTPGGFTKTGAGTLTLNAGANSWAQWTRVTGGTLRLGAAGAMPNGTALKLANGGILDLGSQTVEVASLTYGVDGGSLLNAENATIPDTCTAEISVDEMLAGKSVPLASATDLDKVTVRVTGDLAGLAKWGRYTLVTTDGTFTGKPTFSPAAEDLPVGWFYKTSTKTIQLYNPRGIVVNFR